MNGDLPWNKLLEILFPPVCLSCESRLKTPAEKTEWLCENCKKQIKINNGFYCPACGRRLPAAVKPCHSQTNFILAAVASYETKPVRELIQKLKYNGLKSALKPWPKLINDYLEKIGNFQNFDLANTVILAVPLHKRRERERGFNQAGLIADLVAHSLKNKFGLADEIPRNDCLTKIKSTHSQTECLDYKARTKNITGAFTIANAHAVSGKNIILVDDVFTSGATMKEAVRLLKEAGARKIIGFVLAKA